MKINITYAASADGAPAGFKQAVEAAVAFYEKTFVDPVTINITFGYGEIDGQAMDDDTVGVATPDHGYGQSYAQMRAALGSAATSDFDVTAVKSLPATDPTNGGLFYVPSAQAKLLGLINPNDARNDGFVSLTSKHPVDFDPQPGVPTGQYDATDTLMHEIGHVLGRLDFMGQLSNGERLFSAMDLFRFSPQRLRDPTAADAYLSFDGTGLGVRLNNPSNGGSAADWAGNGSTPYLFDAFARTGRNASIDYYEYNAMEVLGLQRKANALTLVPLPQYASTSAKISVTGAQNLMGQTIYIKDAPIDAEAYLQIDRRIGSTGQAYLPGYFAAYSTGAEDLTGIRLIGAPSVPITATFLGAQFLVRSTGGDVHGAKIDGPATVYMSSTFEVVSNAGMASGFEGLGAGVLLQVSSTIRVSGADDVVGVANLSYRTLSSGVGVEVFGTGAAGTKSTAIAVLDPVSFENGGFVRANALDPDVVAVGVMINTLPQGVFNNSGEIRAKFAIVEDLDAAPAAGQGLSITNSGTIAGTIFLDDGANRLRNSGFIAGEIYFGDGDTVYDGTGGKQAGAIFLGAGTSRVTIGDGGSYIYDGGGSDVVIGGAGYDLMRYSGMRQEAVGKDSLTRIERAEFADGDLWSDVGSTAAKVHRVYMAALGRPPESLGLAEWADRIDSGGLTLKGLADGVVNSQEFADRFGAGTNAAFVTLLYRNVLGREPDALGLQSWVNKLASGVSKADIVLGFSESTENIANTARSYEQGLWITDPNVAKAARLYDTVLGRLPDKAGVTAWGDRLDDGAALAEVAAGFVNSTEFQTVYGALNDTAFVTLLYQNVLHRNPEAEGLTAWTSRLASGTTRSDVVLGFSESREHIVNTVYKIYDDGVWFA